MAAVKMIAGVHNVSPIYTRILSKFPPKCSFCFAYGSGVKQQTGSQRDKQMIDFILCVDNSEQWHTQNIKKHASHYSGLRFFGGGFIAKYQEHLGAQVYFNTLVPMQEEGVLIKYGVTSKEHLIADLVDWNHLYLSGRLHKPVEVVEWGGDTRLQTALESNLSSAVRAALLLLPERFSEFEFYHTISNLSYGGDFRMTFGENKNKVMNIVLPQLPAFRKLYASPLAQLDKYIHIPREDSASAAWRQDTSARAKLYHLTQLPTEPKKLMEYYQYAKSKSREHNVDDSLKNLADDKECHVVLRKAINSIVWKSSVWQSIKGIPTAGLFKSLNYSARKIKKMF